MNKTVGIGNAKNWKRRVVKPFSSLYFFDGLLVIGFILNLIIFGMTIYHTSQGAVETNPLMAGILELGHAGAIFCLGLVWGITFTAYSFLRAREAKYAQYIAFLVFSIFTFNFIHDISVVMGI